MKEGSEIVSQPLTLETDNTKFLTLCQSIGLDLASQVGETAHSVFSIHMITTKMSAIVCLLLILEAPEAGKLIITQTMRCALILEK